MTMPGTIRFEDGAAYERYMGKWSQSVAVRLLDWLAPPPGWRWLDVGCGNGAFTEILGERCAPGALHGIDPSDAQLAFARSRPVSRFARFTAGNAMALPFPEDRFDAAVMPLVISFVPRPATGVGEMARVVRPAGLVAAYIWDTAGGGFPYETLHNELRSRGVAVPAPPSPEVSRKEVLGALWAEAGLVDVETRVFEVQRIFENFEDYWETIFGAPSVGSTLAGMGAAELARLNAGLREKLPVESDGRLILKARANAVRGTVPAKRRA
ncbi:MAG TPA: methyltransferase domain-containing protein [Elusimicrobiota bacterium]|nr:methyltransferase domain-containing protein [Elusimicrobiota bacterium]